MTFFLDMIPNNFLPLKNVHRIFNEPEDNLTRAEANLEKINSEITASTTSVTLQKSKPWEIEQLMERKNPYIIERNKILNSFCKPFIPHYKRRLDLIDNALDELDQKIYFLQSENSIKEDDLNKMILLAEQRLKKYS
jgi:hypothetical protein